MIRVCSMFKKAWPLGDEVVNTTSRAVAEWQRGLSPFFLGPVTAYDGTVFQNVENLWQYSKVYQQLVTPSGFLDLVDASEFPNAHYFAWRQTGANSVRAERYPMGKGAVPLYSWWNGEKLPYVVARRKIYCPVYAEAVEKSDAYKRLQELYEQCNERKIDLWLKDFDGYERGSKSYKQVLNDPNRKMGHAFVLAMMLEGQRVWLED